MKDIETSIQIQTLSLKGGSDEISLFGFAFPYLPDFLSGQDLLGHTVAEKLSETLRQFERFVIGLGNFLDTAYSLRFIFHPGRGAVEICLLCRVKAVNNQSQELARFRSAYLRPHFESYGIPILPLGVTPPKGFSLTLDSARHPFTGGVTVIELRQKGENVPLSVVDKDLFLIHPFWGPAGAGLEPFEVCLHQTQPIAVSVYLQPTLLERHEQLILAESASYAQTMAEVDIQTLSPTGVRRRRDPLAERAGQVYNAYLDSLSTPFLMLVQLVGPDRNAVWAAARAWGSMLMQVQEKRASGPGQLDQPFEPQFCAPQSEAEGQAAYRIFSTLIFERWTGGALQPPEGYERLPYLVGARGASTAFRFPVSVRGGIPGIRVRQIPPAFEQGPRQNRLGIDQIHLGEFQRGGIAAIDKKALVRHALVTGFTGSGKTNTVLYLLHQLWTRYRLPFLVIEAAKKEYRALARLEEFDDLLIFTLGDENTSPFRLNPFELLPGIRLEAHLGRLQACFDAALPQFGILPSIISEAMEKIYKARGWRLTDAAQPHESRLFPTLRDLLAEVVRVTERRGYAGETYNNIRAAAAGRIGSLLQGSRGTMLGGQRSLPAEELFKRPVVLELNDLELDKPLMMMFLLTLLREYMELHPSRELQHVTVVEEAHNVLSNVQSVVNPEISADTKGKSVEAFANMLSEVRSYGEGLIISDQSPEKLAPDAIRNTNLQIAHQLRDRQDRDSIARAMIMDEAQSDYLGKLQIGQAALFYTGMEKATFVMIEPFKDKAGLDVVISDQRVQQHMETFRMANRQAALPFDGCRFCATPCIYRQQIEPYTLVPELHERLVVALKGFERNPEPENWPVNWRSVAAACAEAGMKAGFPANPDAAYCFLAQEIDFPFTRHMRDEFIKALHG